MYRRASLPASGHTPAPRKAVTANVLLDELPREARRVPWAGMSASLVALACLAVLVWQQLAPATFTRAERVQTFEVATYTIEQTAQLGELMVLIGRLVGLTDSGQVHVFSINPGPTAQPGGVTLDDGDGNRVDVVPASEQVPARSIQHRVIEVGGDFDVVDSNFRVRRNSKVQDWQ